MKHILFAFITAYLSLSAALGSERWTEPHANAWYANVPWPVGSNYLPASASNELEMWQAATFDPKRIDTELGWAESLGMNTMRVFLHDLPWKENPAGFKERIGEFLEICAKHKIRPIFVLFDSCWDPAPHLGQQRAPTPGVHNSDWVQSPGAAALNDPRQYPRLESYVKGILTAFGHDQRVLAWDIWNEPDNRNDSSYGKSELANKTDLIDELLPKAFAWARSTNPLQPLTSGIWHEEPGKKLSKTAEEQINLSDIISFHNYGKPLNYRREVEWLRTYHRPLICTEYMARPMGSTFATILPIDKRWKIGAINWGFVAGKSQTYLPWDSWQHPYVKTPPAVWFHDIFQTDGKPYRREETEFIRSMTGK